MLMSVFDLGGTWFRSAVMTTGGNFVAASRRPAIGIRFSPQESKEKLVERCIAFLHEEHARLEQEVGRPITEASVSLGAAMNGLTGEVLSSGPLWGGDVEPFVMATILEQKRPGVRWGVFNDVSCSLYGYLTANRSAMSQRTLLVTVSSGVAARLYDPHTQSIPVDKRQGVQGEIGHLTVDARFADLPLNRQCDCGGDNHLNAFSSGRGIERTLHDLANGHLEACNVLGRNSPFVSTLVSKRLTSPADRFELLRFSVANGDCAAIAVLSSATRPLSGIISTILTHDPIIDGIVLVGGVIDALEGYYLDSLCEQVEINGLYGISTRDRHFFRRRIIRAAVDEGAGMRGAAIMMRE